MRLSLNLWEILLFFEVFVMILSRVLIREGAAFRWMVVGCWLCLLVLFGFDVYDSLVNFLIALLIHGLG